MQALAKVRAALRDLTSKVVVHVMRVDDDHWMRCHSPHLLENVVCEERKVDEDDVKLLSEQEVARSDALSLLPNCYCQTRITLKTPSTDLLPYRAWR